MDRFESIRPYTDQEAREALQRMAKDSHIDNILSYVMPGADSNQFRDLLRSLSGVYDFQMKVMYGVVRSIIEKTADGVSYEGVEELKKGKTHVIVSNHRDIVLDPAILQKILADNDVHTTQICVGDNLISSQFIEDICRTNGMVKVVRGGTPREKFFNSTLLSEYLRSRVASNECSVWIAQRNGRTKDGADATEQGLMKMFQMSGSGDFYEDFKELNILPLSISYQFEPCDFLKARELYISRRGQYVKSPGEDLRSILHGVMQKKGKIHFCFNESISDEILKSCSGLNKNERFKELASRIDAVINGSYKLWNNNYIAKDILSGKSDYLGCFYTLQERDYFIEYMEKGLSAIVDKEPFIQLAELREIFLSIYANPVR